MAEESKMRVVIKLMDAEEEHNFPLLETKQTIDILLSPEQEALIRTRLERIRDSEDEKGHSDKLLWVGLSLLVKDSEGDDIAITYGKNVKISATCRAVVEVMDGKLDAESARQTLSP